LYEQHITLGGCEMSPCIRGCGKFVNRYTRLSHSLNCPILYCPFDDCSENFNEQKKACNEHIKHCVRLHFPEIDKLSLSEIVRIRNNKWINRIKVGDNIDIVFMSNNRSQPLYIDYPKFKSQIWEEGIVERIQDGKYLIKYKTWGSIWSKEMTINQLSVYAAPAYTKVPRWREELIMANLIECKFEDEWYVGQIIEAIETLFTIYVYDENGKILQLHKYSNDISLQGIHLDYVTI
jgi:hypothetical protein